MCQTNLIIMTSRNFNAPTLLEKIHQVTMDNNHNELFGTAKLADQLGLSRSSLHRRLKAETGLTTSQVIRKIRLN